LKLKHDPEKWTLVFGKDHAQTTAKAKYRINLKSFRALVRASLHQTRLARSLNGDQGNSPRLRRIFINRGGDENKPRSRGRKAYSKWRSDMLRFILVNDRMPRVDVHCALCCTKIAASYVREINTRFYYCSRGCFASLPGWDSLCSNTVVELCDEVRLLPQASRLDRPALSAHAILLAGLQSRVSATS
jgi:hypothetical protein